MSDEDAGLRPLWVRIIRGALALFIPLGVLGLFMAGAVYGLTLAAVHGYALTGACGILMWSWVSALFEVLEARKRANTAAK